MHLVDRGWLPARRRMIVDSCARRAGDAAAGAAERVGRATISGQAPADRWLRAAATSSVDDPRFRAPARRSRASASWNSSRSSAFWIASSGVPSSRTSYRSSTPASASCDGEVQAGLPAERRQQAIRPLSRDDRARQTRRSAARCRRGRRSSGSVMIVAGLELTRTRMTPSSRSDLARLRAGVVELRRLPDDDRAGADHHHFLYACVFWHIALAYTVHTDGKPHDPRK